MTVRTSFGSNNLNQVHLVSAEQTCAMFARNSRPSFLIEVMQLNHVLGLVGMAFLNSFGLRSGL